MISSHSNLADRPSDEGKPPWSLVEQSSELMRDAANGDAAARGELLNQHRDSLRRIIDMRLDRQIRRRVDASDIVQNVLVSADRRLNEYFANPQVPFFVWLRQLARDSVIDAYRKHRASKKRSVDREQQYAPAGHRSSINDMFALLSNQQLTPSAEVALLEFRELFELALHAIGEKDREILIMRHYELLSNKEAATILSISEHAASMRHVRALRSIGKQLRRKGYDETND